MDPITAVFDFLLILLGFILGIGSRLKPLFIFIQVATLIVKMAKWYYETHPQGKKDANKTNLDQKFKDIYDDKLKLHDPITSMIGMEVVTDDLQNPQAAD